MLSMLSMLRMQAYVHMRSAPIHLSFRCSSQIDSKRRIETQRHNMQEFSKK